jgi:hypothetical protein
VADLTYIRILDPVGTLVGILPATVSWRARLQGSDVVDACQIGATVQKADGTAEDRLWMLDTGWQFLFGDGRYIIDTISGDFETGLTIQATSAEMAELENFFTNYSPGPATYLNCLPSRMLTAVLAGRVGRPVKNPGFGILDSGNLPTNWTHPTGWTAPLVANRRVWQAPAAGTISLSDDIPCMAGLQYQVGITACAVSAGTGNAELALQFQALDGSWATAETVSIPADGTAHTVLTDAATAVGRRMRLGLSNAGSVAVWFDDARSWEIGPDSGWTYSGSMDTRPALIPFNAGTIEKYGVWTIGATDISGDYPGDWVGQIFNGPFVTIGFAAGGASASCKVRINGKQYEASGTTLVPGTTPIDVSTAVSLTCPGLDPSNSHTVEVEIVDGTVKVTGFTVTTDNLISMQWDYKSLFEAVASVVKAVGGELSFDAVAKTITHVAALGSDLRAANIVTFRRGWNVTKLARKRDRQKVCNDLTLLCYGDGQYQLVVNARATGERAGKTSEETYGVRRGTSTDKELKDLATAQAKVATMVEQTCWDSDTYTIGITDTEAALIVPGDTIHFLYKSLDLSRRVLEVQRSTGNLEATLVVGDPASSLELTLNDSRRDLATLQKSYQGVPTDSNTSFSEAFERTPGGSDYPAEVNFFVPYGADMLDLRLRYQVGGMRAYAKSALAGGADLVTSQSQEQEVVSSESSSESTTTAQMINVHYELDALDTILFTVAALGVHDKADTANALTVTAHFDRGSCNTFLAGLTTKFNGHIPHTDYHKAADGDNAMTAPDNTTLESLCGSANAAKGKLIAHVNRTASHYAFVDDAPTAADATDEPSLVTLCADLDDCYTAHIPRANTSLFAACNLIKSKINTHMHSAVYHSEADSQTISSPDADSVASGVTLMTEVITKYDLHIGKISIHRISDVSNVAVATVTDADTLLYAASLVKVCANHHFLGLSEGGNSGIRIATSRQVQVADTARSIECEALTGGEGITFSGLIQNNGSAEATYAWTLYGTFPGDAESVLDTGTETIAAGGFAMVSSSVDEGFAVRFEVTQTTGDAWDTDGLIGDQPGTPAVTGPAEGGGGGDAANVASTTVVIAITETGEFESEEWTHGFDSAVELVRLLATPGTYDDTAIEIRDLRVVQTSATTCKIVGYATVL